MPHSNNTNNTNKAKPKPALSQKKDSKKTKTNKSVKEPTLLDTMLAFSKFTLPAEQKILENAACGLITQALISGKDTVLWKALDQLWEQDATAYERLVDYTEHCAQSFGTPDGKSNLLIVIPILMWSRIGLPSGGLSAKAIDDLSAVVQQVWLAPTTQLILDSKIYHPDKLPHDFHKIYQLAHKHFESASTAQPLTRKRLPTQQEPSHFLADCRFILGVVRWDCEHAVFQAQLDTAGTLTLAAQETAWKTLATEALAPHLTGCAYHVMSPEPFYEGSRNAELALRGFSLQAAVALVMSTADVPVSDLRIVIVACHNTEFEEYRISILLKSDDEVLQGLSWPLLGRDETQADLLKEIHWQLQNLGIQRVRVIEESASMEYCEDCEEPLFADPNADMVHAGFPDDDDPNHSQTVH